jgi:hypothetical protein
MADMIDELNSLSPSHNSRTSAIRRGLIYKREELAITITILALLGVLWVVTRPYSGVVNDGRFYMLPALRDLDPAAFVSDLFFRFGSQDQYSIFHHLYLPFLPILGIGGTGILFTVVGQVLWISAAIALAHTLLPQRLHAWLAVGSVIVLPNLYVFFGYGEPFASPRLFAEAFSIFGLALLLRGQAITAIGLLVASAVFHPLVAIAAIGFAFIYLAVSKPIWSLVPVVGAIALVALSFTDVHPFEALRATYDQQWFDVVKDRDAMSLVTHWSADSYFRIATTLSLTILAFVFSEGRVRTVLSATFVVGIGGIIVTLLGGDWARNTFIVEVQPWRSMWLLAVVVNLLAAPTAVRVFEANNDEVTKSAISVGAIFLVMAELLPGYIFLATPVIVIAAASVVWRAVTAKPLGKPIASLCLVVVFLAVAAALGLLTIVVTDLASLPDVAGPLALRVALSVAVIATSLLAFGKRLARIDRIARLAPYFSAALLLVAVTFSWDQRSSWTKFVESPELPPTSLTSLLPDNASVYSEAGNELLWFKLRRASYFSCDHGAGTLFYRDTALEFEHRREAFMSIWPLDFGDTACGTLKPKGQSTTTAEELGSLCGRESELDYLILIRPVRGVEAKIWESPAPIRYSYSVRDGERATITETNQLYVYSCAFVLSRAGHS